jgi:hypothetical protein
MKVVQQFQHKEGPKNDNNTASSIHPLDVFIAMASGPDGGH